MSKIVLLASNAVAAAALAGCVAYPVYQQPVARLTPAQSVALAARPVDPAERDRLAKLNSQVQTEDQADIDAQRQAYTYAYPEPYYTSPYYGYPYYGYPYYGGFYPWVPGVSLSLGFGFHRGFGGFRRGSGGFHGGFGGRGGWGGGRGHR